MVLSKGMWLCTEVYACIPKGMVAQTTKVYRGIQKFRVVHTQDHGGIVYKLIWWYTILYSGEHNYIYMLAYTSIGWYTHVYGDLQTYTLVCKGIGWCAEMY